MKSIILKSSSPRRKELLTNMGYSFTIKVYDVDETMDMNKTPYENVKELGLKKASINKELDYGSILIGCDTIVVLDSKIFGKPKDRLDAYNMLRALSGKRHEVMSGLAVIYKEHVYNLTEVSSVYFKELSDKDIYDYKSDNITIENEGLVNLKKVCQKYNIPLSDVGDVLEEYIVYDNAEYLEKLKQ